MKSVLSALAVLGMASVLLQLFRHWFTGWFLHC